MLFVRMSSAPKITVGLSIACDIPDRLTASSTSALPRKYGNGESAVAFVMLTWTIRRTPASSAA